MSNDQEPTPRGRWDRCGDFVLQALVRLSPKAFRFSNEREILDHASCLLAASPGPMRKAKLWCRLALNLLCTAIRLHLDKIFSPYRVAPKPAEQVRANRRRSDLLSDLPSDLRGGLRLLAKHKIATLVATLSMGMGIGGTTATFTALNGILLTALPVESPRELFEVKARRVAGDFNISYPIFEALHREQEVFSGMFAASGSELVRAQRDGRALSNVFAESVSGDYFEVLRVGNVKGRSLNRSDDSPGGGDTGPAAMISHAFWKRQFLLDPKAIGETLTVEGLTYTIVGITPSGFFGASLGSQPDVWLPMSTSMPESRLSWRTGTFFKIMARVDSDLAQELVEERASALLQRVLDEEEQQGLKTMVRAEEQISNLRIGLEPAANGFGTLRTSYSLPLQVLMGIVCLVLLIACCNIAALQLAQVTSRRREFATRAALGASRIRVFRQLLAENLLLACFGGIVGLILAPYGLRMLSTFLVENRGSQALTLELDLRMLAFTATVTAATGVLFGLLPALRGSGISLQTNLRAGAGNHTPTRSARRLGSALVIGQLALALVLLIGSGLLLKSLVLLNQVDLGFEPERVLSAAVSFKSKQQTPESREQFLTRLDQELSSIPGVTGVAYSWLGLFSTADLSAEVEIEGFEVSEEPPEARLNAVSPGYFETHGSARLEGRAFTDSDRLGAPTVTIVNSTFHEMYFGEEAAIGKTIQLSGDDRVLEIVGVYEDLQWNNLREEKTPMFFLASRQWDMPVGSVAVRTDTNPSSLSRTVEERLQGLGAGALITRIEVLSAWIDSTVSRERILARLATIFGALGLFLAGIGLYGLLASVVASQRSEFAVRMALGATQRQVAWLIQRRNLGLVSAGGAVGIPIALLSSRLLGSFVFGLKTTDVVTLATAIIALLVIGLATGYLPARKAGRLQVISALRHE